MHSSTILFFMLENWWLSMEDNKMRIFQTLNSGDNIVKLEDEIKYLENTDVNGIRFNLCKYKSEELPFIIKNIYSVMSKLSKRFELSFDLPYPKNKARIRRFNVEHGKIIKGNTYKIVKNIYKDQEIKDGIYIEVSEFKSDLIEGSLIYFGDGEGAFLILKKSNDYIEVEAVNDFEIFNNKGITCGFVTDENVCFEVIDQVYNLFNESPTILLSFVQSEEEIIRLKNKFNGLNLKLIPKIELVKSSDEIPKIVNICDGALLARGDLGLLSPIKDMFNICKITSKCTKRSNKRLFAATDILSSLEYRSFPSRADIIDLCILSELECTDIVLPYKISARLNDIIKYISYFNV